MEGGGSGVGTKAALRQGMNAFLGEIKDAARMRSWKWNLVPCGGRAQAFRAYRNAKKSNDSSIVVLLVDSEGPVETRVHQHLKERDEWNVAEEEEAHIHLMVQTMETWIVADASALAECYQKDFNSTALPRPADLETVPKSDIASSLMRATDKTQKGKYHKIRHASDLLKKIDPQIVRSRCSHCARMFDLLGKEIA